MSIVQLQRQIRKSKTPILLTVEILEEFVPKSILDTCESPLLAIETYGKQVLDLLTGVVPGIKMVPCAFEIYGSQGVAVMERLLAYAKELGYFTLVETMRSDGAERSAYCAKRYFDSYSVDGLVVCPFLGTDGLKVYSKYCKEQGKTIFVTSKTPNQSGREMQDLLAGDRHIYAVVAEQVERCGGAMITSCGFGEMGLSLSTRHPEVLKEMRRCHEASFFLLEGYGEGASLGKDASHGFDQFGYGAVVTTGWRIWNCWQDKEGDYQEHITAWVARMKRLIKEYVTIL